eukprot:TRINITY_DN9028_c0_g1_i1.p1 TRINITY_DN9028_c0_g1~~TRINITY_DN9028_c0_g1_i1.p1  ORF type:complete len:512 (+),score=119.95 TRINITY_DN9028_c0_g1_i1:145-1680(+)
MSEPNAKRIKRKADREALSSSDGWSQDQATGYLYHPQRQIYYDPANDKYFRLDLHTQEFREYDVSGIKGLQRPTLQKRKTSTTSGDTVPDNTATGRTSTSSLSGATLDDEATVDVSAAAQPEFKSQDELLPLRVATETWTGRKDDNEDRYAEHVPMGPLGRLYGIYDGHAGAVCADYVKRCLPGNIAGAFRHYDSMSGNGMTEEDKKGLRTQLSECETQLLTIMGALESNPEDASMLQMQSDVAEMMVAISGRLEAADQLNDGYKAAALKAMRDGYKCTDKNWTSQAAKKKTAGGSTSLTVVVNGEGPHNAHLIISNLGDCRAVLCRGQQAHRLTEDHKPDRKDEEKRIKQAGGRVLRMMGVPRVTCAAGDTTHGNQPMYLAVSRAFGDYTLKVPKPIVSHIPEVSIEHIGEEDMFAVIACDGIWDVLSDQEVVDIVKQHHSRPSEGAASVVRTAYQKGSQDNLTAMVIEFAWQDGKVVFDDGSAPAAEEQKDSGVSETTPDTPADDDMFA